MCVCLVEVAVIFHYLFSIVCRLFVLGSTGYFLYVVHFYRNPATGYAENKEAGGTGCAEISSHTIGMDFGEFRVARRFAECAC